MDTDKAKERVFLRVIMQTFRQKMIFLYGYLLTCQQRVQELRLKATILPAASLSLTPNPVNRASIVINQVFLLMLLAPLKN